VNAHRAATREARPGRGGRDWDNWAARKSVIVFELLADPAKRFQDLGPDHYAKRMDTGRRTAKLTSELHALGWSVTLTPLAA
jgi:hypothetical protein